MAKVLRVFVVILFILSIGGLVLGILLFNQRLLNKERTQTLEAGVSTIAQELTAAKEPHVRAIDQRVDAQALMSADKAAREGQIELVRRLVQTRRDQHVQEGEEHLVTKGKLTQTEAELFATRQQLADVRAELAGERQKVQTLTADVAAKQGTIDQLTTEVQGLTATVADLRAQIAKKDEEIANQVVDIRRLEDIVKKYEDAETTTAARLVKPGLTGEIIAVNPEWNFVVLNIGSESTLVPTAEMLVHRGEELIGRVRVLTVTDKLAIADIMRGEWERGVTLQEGDRVLF